MMHKILPFLPLIILLVICLTAVFSLLFIDTDATINQKFMNKYRKLCKRNSKNEDN